MEGSDELEEGHIEAFFKINVVKSYNLNISKDAVDDPMVVNITSISCGENFTNGSTSEIVVVASDLDDTILGSLSVDGHVYPFAEGGIKIDYTWDRPGNVQVELFAVNSRGDRRRVITSVMIVDDDPTVAANYVAACITKPADFSDIISNNVRFDASTSRGLQNSSGALTNVPKEGLYFSWRFSDGLVNLNHDGATEPESYLFYKNFIQAGNNWAELDVELK